MLDTELVQKAKAALAPLTSEEAQRQGRTSEYAPLLNELRPIIIEARGKRHSWKRIAQSLQTAGMKITAETVRRHIMSGAPLSINTKRRRRRKGAHAQAGAISSKPPQASPPTPAPPTQVPPPRPTHRGAQRPKQL